MCHWTGDLSVFRSLGRYNKLLLWVTDAAAERFKVWTDLVGASKSLYKKGLEIEEI